MRRAFGFAVIFLSAITIGCSASAKSGSNSPPPATGEISRALSIVVGARARVSGLASAPLSEVMLPRQTADSALVANSLDTGYFARHNVLEAVNLATGRPMWTSAPSYYLQTVTASATDVFVASAPTLRGTSLVALNRRSGRRVFSLRDGYPGSVVDGVLYAQSKNAYATYDAISLRPLWKTLGGGMQLTGAPIIDGDVLLQSFMNSGAILEGQMYAFNLKNGHNLWMHLSDGKPIGYSQRTVYLNSTWFPSQVAGYVPLTVDRVALVSGKTVDSYTYQPDPRRNANTFRSFDNAKSHALVVGGYVYLTVSGGWYRYDADTQPSRAHPFRLEGIRVLAGFDNGALLVQRRDGVDVAQSFSDHLELHRVSAQALRSGIIKRTDGSRFVVLGDVLFAFDALGVPTKVGRVDCGDIGEIAFWPSRVVVRCKGTNRLLVFRESSAPSLRAVARPQPAATPKFAPRIRTFEIPRAKTFIKQWWVGSIAAVGQGLVFTLGGGALNFQSAIGRYSGGHFTITMLPGGAAPMHPSAIVADAHGKIFFNDDHHAAVMQLSSSGRVTPVIGSVPSPSPTDSAGWKNVPRLVPGIRLAIGPDGYAWFARSHPRGEIGRVDGSRTFDLPDGWGDALVLRGGGDGALWFLTQTRVGRLTLTGRFTSLPLPRYALRWRGFPLVGLTPGWKGTIWLSVGRRLIEMNAHRVLRTIALPNAGIGVRAATVGCNGSLYAAETVSQIARISKDGKLEEYVVPLSEINGLVRAPDCSIWFIAGSNAPRQEIGQFQLVPR